MLVVRSSLWVAWAALALVAVGCGGGSWQQMVERANRADKPLIVEFWATWCRPCKRFESEVLADARVKRELEGFVFERFDFDRAPGIHYARRLGVRAVPTVVAVGSDGEPIGGLRGAVSADRFIEFLRWSRAKRQPSGGSGPPSTGR